MSSVPNTTKAAEPVLQVLDALAHFAATGATNKDLAEACKTTAVVVSRATATLISYGWCRKSEESGRFYPTPKFMRLTFACMDDFQRAEKRLQDQRLSMTGH
ncbi:IclR family transcriptional regulator [Comamonas koreensis]|uniref:HTH iclR-type domain-containing protein n=1 Tax=Comamonas koreensis TaxID=160825 RepID=A0AAW4XVH6_9BURK|nr:hypothetical protein [Comamonas koreensis]MCD2164676.1 hypothetical protein [Comamonas koreensis]